jgi:hypothetical protein
MRIQSPGKYIDASGAVSITPNSELWMFCHRRQCVIYLPLTAAPHLTFFSFRFVQQDSVSLNAQTTPDFQAKKAMFYEEHMHEDAEVRLIVQGVGFFDIRNDSDDWVRDTSPKIHKHTRLKCHLLPFAALTNLSSSSGCGCSFLACCLFFESFALSSHRLPSALHSHSHSSQVRVCVETGDLLVLPAGIYHRFAIDEQVMLSRLLHDHSNVFALPAALCHNAPFCCRLSQQKLF